MQNSASKPAIFLPGVEEVIAEMPAPVKRTIGYSLRLAQEGRKSDDAKPLKGFGGAGVLEIVASHDGDTFRAVYTVRFAEAVFVLHAFQKKSKHGIATPKKELDLIEARLRRAEEMYREQFPKEKP